MTKCERCADWHEELKTIQRTLERVREALRSSEEQLADAKRHLRFAEKVVGVG